MSCVSPLDGYRSRGGAVIIVPRGDRPPRDATTRIAIPIPCKKCVGCRMDKAQEWGVRCVHEAKLWKQNSYVTLTYASEYLPPGMSLSLRDVQLFMKRLRKARSSTTANPIRFFLAGEYGETNGRPHYHALLFNCGFGDLVLYGTNKRGEKLYTSRELSDLWSVDGQTLGFCTVGAVTFDSAVYCAKYSMKSLSISEGSSPEAKEEFERKYVCLDAVTGEVILRRKEFAVMSRKPGIGGGFFDKFGQEIINNDSCIINGREIKPPRYYDERAKQSVVAHDDAVVLCRCSVCVNKRGRKRRAVLNKADNTPARLRVKGRLMEIAAEKKERNL